MPVFCILYLYNVYFKTKVEQLVLDCAKKYGTKENGPIFTIKTSDLTGFLITINLYFIFQ